MCAEKKKFILDLPLKVILTEDGTSHFLSHKKQLLTLQLADNRSAHGVSLDHFSPGSLQNMILLDYISKMEISMPEFVSHRQEVMDLSKLIVFSILYKQFDREIYSQIIRGNDGVASAISAILTFSTIIALAVFFKVSGKKEITM